MSHGTPPDSGTAGVVVAAFDVDGTLTTRDCVRPFLERVAGRRGIVGALVRQPVATVIGGVRRDRDVIKEIVVGGVYRGRQVTDLDALGHQFAGVVEQSMLRPDVVARMRWHQAVGHRTVIVSASLRSYLQPLAASLGIDRAICTDVVSEDGRYLDRLDGGNCRAGEKWARLAAWLDGEGLRGAELWAYGDSRGDREMLAAAHHAVWVRGATIDRVPAEIGS
ncbi:MAG: HAD-IB family hydrolase [Ilumatobacteraceae bacterium]